MSLANLNDSLTYQHPNGDPVRAAEMVVAVPGAPAAPWSYAAAVFGIANTTTAVTIQAAAGAGLRNYLTGLQVSHATLGAATELAIRDGAGGAVLWRGTLGTEAVENASCQFSSPLAGAANTLLEVVTLAPVTGGVYVNAQGYVAP
jgi:hypothetical protein